MNADCRDDHHRKHQCRTDRSEKPERDQKTAAEFGRTGRGGEETARAPSERFEKAACSGDAVAAEPAEQLLRTMRGHHQPNDQTCQEQTLMNHLSDFLS